MTTRFNGTGPISPSASVRRQNEQALVDMADHQRRAQPVALGLRGLDYFFGPAEIVELNGRMATIRAADGEHHMVLAYWLGLV